MSEELAHSSPASTAPCEAEGKNKDKNDAKRAAKMEKFLAKQAKAEQFKSSNSQAAKPKSLDLEKKISEQKQVIMEVPYGEKKDLSQPMANAYDPVAVEASWGSWWEHHGFFKPEGSGRGDDDTQKPFVIVMPPPNVTGSLHLGHAIMLAVEDALVRWNRMKGRKVLYLPGCDHAGIATQAVVEKMIYKEQKITRHDLGRENFVKEIWKWKDQYGGKIYEQIRRMGVSADWSRVSFTLDPKLSNAVTEAFIKLFDDGLISRSNRLVNWCGKLKTSLSDLEVEMKEIEGGAMLPAHGHDPKKKYKFGTMTYIAYKIEDGADGEEIVIATTRPETVFADSAICVHPADARFIKYHGKSVIHPVLGHKIPIICDEAADPEFGTGALKISPAHDQTDFAVGKKHNLKFIVIYDENNILNENCGSFAGMLRYDAREAVVDFVKRNGTFRDEKLYPMSIPICSRSGDFVEPRLIPQWWLNCQDMAAKSVDAVRSGKLEIFPKEHEKVWYHWLENIRDWCLSRQLWWGHRIPAYRVRIEESFGSEKCLESETWVAARNEEEALKLAYMKFPAVEPSKIKVFQDEDVLDTWFSSALWPFSTLGWPTTSDDLDKFYPNQLLETGSDILFFWVARMVMMGIYLTGQLPFSQVFLHAIVRDAHGRKMSKSLGNVIDPVDVIQGISLAELQQRLDQGNMDPKEVKIAKEGQKQDFPHGIPQCGSDALRLGLCSYVSDSRDINMNINRIEGYRRFCNKLWNATKFALMKLGDGFVPTKEVCLLGGESMIDLWILARLNKSIGETNMSFASFNLMAATQAIYSFWLYELCDVYIEAIKPICSQDNPNIAARKCAENVLYICLEQGLRLLHPFMPFVTEELYQRLPRRPDDMIPSISLSPYPLVRQEFINESIEANFGKVFNVVKAVRRVASEQKLPRNTIVELSARDKDAFRLFQSQETAINSLIRSVGTLQICETLDAPQDGYKIDDDCFEVRFATST